MKREADGLLNANAQWTVKRRQYPFNRIKIVRQS